MTNDLDEPKTCIYCDKQKPTSKFSYEHIWPDTFGGDLLPELFQTSDVCRSCNSTCGLYVDGPFAKGMLIKFETTMKTEIFADPHKPNTMPFSYMGFDEDFPCQDGDVCERWIGPSGEHIYHVHEKDNDAWQTYAGGDIIKRKKKNPGRVYMAMTSKEDYWVLTAVLSFKKHFKNAKRCLVNMELDFNVKHYDKLIALFPTDDDADELQKQELNYIRMRDDRNVHTIGVLDIGFEQRFLCKFALAIGFKLFGANFLKTPYAKNLREGLWCQNFQDRQGIKIRGSGAYDHNNEHYGGLAEWHSIDGAWCITLRIIANELAGIITSPSGNMRVIVITDEPSLFEHKQFDIYRDGQFFAVVPDINDAIGPIPFPNVLAHFLSNQNQSDIAELEKRRIPKDQLPPKNIGM